MTMRVFSLIAGVAAIAAAVARFFLGAGDLAMLGSAPIAAIVWHALTYAMALVGAAVIASSRAGQELAVAMPMLATAFFGGIAAIMAVTAAISLHDPFAYYPVFVLAGVAALNALAAARA
jgi:hypothetical protein